jgi:hypothetical protein
MAKVSAVTDVPLKCQLLASQSSPQRENNLTHVETRQPQHAMEYDSTVYFHGSNRLL